MSTSSSSQSLKIGIVGFGSFGPFLAKTMIKQGHTLRATSRTNYSELCLQMGIHFFRVAGCYICPMRNMIKWLRRGNLSHTHTIGRTLAEMDSKSTPIDTKGFQALVQLKKTIMRGSFDLYSGLFVHNRFTKQELEILVHALYKVKETLVQRLNEK